MAISQQAQSWWGYKFDCLNFVFIEVATKRFKDASKTNTKHEA